MRFPLGACCTRDEGRPHGVGLQGLNPNYRLRLRSNDRQNGGAHWTFQSAGSAETLASICLADGLTGFAALDLTYSHKGYGITLLTMLYTGIPGKNGVPYDFDNNAPEHNTYPEWVRDGEKGTGMFYAGGNLGNQSVAALPPG